MLNRSVSRLHPILRRATDRSSCFHPPTLKGCNGEHSTSVIVQPSRRALLVALRQNETRVSVDRSPPTCFGPASVQLVPGPGHCLPAMENVSQRTPSISAIKRGSRPRTSARPASSGVDEPLQLTVQTITRSSADAPYSHTSSIDPVGGSLHSRSRHHDGDLMPRHRLEGQPPHLAGESVSSRDHPWSWP
jgi:hypothetical protein